MTPLLRCLPFLLLLTCLPAAANANDLNRQDVYERVMKKGEIRCGYALRPRGLFHDMENGGLSGIGYDLTEEIGKRLSLKINWAEETGYGTLVESIKTSRIDAGCGIYWPNSARSRYVYFTAPIFYENSIVYQRADDTRRFKSPEELDSDAYSFSVIDGGTPIMLQKQLFPKSRAVALPELSGQGETFEALINGKVDFVIQAEWTVADFEKARPGMVRQALPEPLAYYPIVMFLPSGETQMKTMFDTALKEIEYDGTLDRILKKYGVENMVRKNPKPVAVQ